jgi:hypothetical protein
MNTIEIKIGDCVWGCTTVVVRRQWDFIAHNDNCYRVHLEDYNIDLKIAKDTEEARELTEAIEAKISDERLISTCLGFCLPHLNPDDFVDLVRGVKLLAFKNGRNSLRSDLKELLEQQ